MQIVTRRAGTLLASVLSIALTGLIGASAVNMTADVDQQDLVGKKAPDFTLTDLAGKEHKLSDYTAQGKTVVLEWFNPDCPFVVKHYENEADTMDALHKEFKNRNVVWLAINSGKEGHPTADREKNLAAHKNWEMQHPILMDSTGKVGKAYGAVTTPNMYIIDTEGVLRYAGAIDNDRRRGIGDTNFVRNALTAVLAGETVATPFEKPYGCSVKY